MRQGRLASLLMLGTTLAAAQAAQAVLITFDTPGYSASGSIHTVDGGISGAEIVGQGDSSTWAISSHNFAVVANAGNGGDNNGLVTATTQHNSQSVTYTPSLAELGAAAFSTHSQQNFSLDIKLIDDGDLDDSTEINRVYIGLQSSSVYPVYLSIRADGSVVARGANSTSLTMSDALTDSAYHTISGVIDYATNTYTVALDGTPLTGNVDFYAPGTFTSYGQFKLNNRRSGVDSGQATTDSSGIAVDNISLSVTVPEPATAAMLGLCATFGILYRRRGSARKQAR